MSILLSSLVFVEEDIMIILFEGDKEEDDDRTGRLDNY